MSSSQIVESASRIPTCIRLTERPMSHFVLTVDCRSTRGIVAAISGYLADKGCNIIDSSQFDDLDTGKFFMRVSFISRRRRALGELEKGFAPVAEPFAMDYRVPRRGTAA